MTGKAFEHRLTPNASENEIFLMNLWIDLKYTDRCNLELKETLYVYVLLSQWILASMPARRWCRLLKLQWINTFTVRG